MSTEHDFPPGQQTEVPSQQPEWGAPQQPRTKPRWSGRRTVAAVAIALGIAAAGGVAVYTASGSTAATQGGGQGGRFGGPGGMGGQFGMGLANALHGEFVVPDGNSGNTTQLMQTGEVTEVSSSSISLRSTDGYTKTYAVDSETVVGNGNSDISSVKTGTTVTVIATISGTDATAKSINDRSTVRNQQGGQQAPPGQQPGGAANGN